MQLLARVEHAEQFVYPHLSEDGLVKREAVGEALIIRRLGRFSRAEDAANHNGSSLGELKLVLIGSDVGEFPINTFVNITIEADGDGDALGRAEE